PPPHEPAHALRELWAVDPHVEGPGHMAFAERGGIAEVDDTRARSDRGRRLLRGEGARLRRREWHEPTVFRDDRVEGRRLGRHALHQEVDEARLVAELQRLVETPLEADGGTGLRGHRAAAHRAGAVSGIDLDA